MTVAVLRGAGHCNGALAPQVANQIRISVHRQHPPAIQNSVAGLEGYGSLESPRFEILEREQPSLQRSEEHTSELQSLMRISYAVFCLKKKKKPTSTMRYRSTDNNNIRAK